MCTQVNGKTRGTVDVAIDITQADAVVLAMASPNVSKYLDGKAVTKIVFVAGKILNLIVK